MFMKMYTNLEIPTYIQEISLKYIYIYFFLCPGKMLGEKNRSKVAVISRIPDTNAQVNKTLTPTHASECGCIL